MKKFKRTIAVGAMVLALGATSATAFAASDINSPAEALAALTGKTLEDVVAERAETGKSYGTIAKESGQLEAFQKEMIQLKKDALAEKVAAGTITQERADEIITAIEKNQALCDGTGSAGVGRMMGAGFGKGQGYNNGQGFGNGNGGQRNFNNCGGQGGFGN